MIRIRNANAASQPATPPTAPGGRPYRFEMIHDGGSARTYADSPAELVEALSPDYSTLQSPRERAAARIRLALRFQVHLQSLLALGPELQGCTTEEQAVLLGSRERPPTVTLWDAAVPLVLVSVFYQPTGRLPRPEAEDPSRLVWIDTDDDWSLLLSLHKAGVIAVNVHDGGSAPAVEEH